MWAILSCADLLFKAAMLVCDAGLKKQLTNQPPLPLSHRQSRKVWHFRRLCAKQKPSRNNFWEARPTYYILLLGCQRKLYYSFQIWTHKTRHTWEIWWRMKLITLSKLYWITKTNKKQNKTITLYFYMYIYNFVHNVSLGTE